MDTAPIPDIAGRDVLPSPTPRELANQLEAENGERLQRIARLGVDPNRFAGVAQSLRLEALIDTLPDHVQAVVDVNYEAALAAVLDGVIADLTKPKLVVPE